MADATRELHVKVLRQQPPGVVRVKQSSQLVLRGGVGDERVLVLQVDVLDVRYGPVCEAAATAADDDACALLVLARVWLQRVLFSLQAVAAILN